MHTDAARDIIMIEEPQPSQQHKGKEQIVNPVHPNADELVWKSLGKRCSNTATAMATQVTRQQLDDYIDTA